MCGWSCRSPAAWRTSVKNGELDAAVFVDDSPQERKGMLLDTAVHRATDRCCQLPDCAPPGSDFKKLLREQPFLRFDRRTPSGMRIEQTLRKLGLVPQDFLELSSLSAIIDLVRQNVGVTIVPHVKNADWANDALLRVLPLPGRPATRLVGMLEQGKREHITSVIRQHLVQLLAEKSAVAGRWP
jgi:DNA-binding transcriptional LysR family regulator